MVEVADPFEDASLAAVSDDVRVVVLDFGASWCGPCKRQDPIFKRVARTFQEETPQAPVLFGLADVDQNQALAREIDVKSVPTTVILARETSVIWGERWQEKARFTGVVPYPRMVDEVKQRLEQDEA